MSTLATRFLPFADAASHDLPLGRLLRLSMFQLVIGMIMALMVGTLNRVMIVELHVPAWWVAIAVAIPMVFAPLRTLIGYRSDTHPSALGLRRIPYLWTGSLLLFGGLSVMPFALLLLAEAVPETLWLGQLGAGLSFILIGTGLQVTQTAGMALANDVAQEDKRPRVVALLYCMLLLGMIVWLVLGRFHTAQNDSSHSKLCGPCDCDQSHLHVETRIARCQTRQTKSRWFCCQLERVNCFTPNASIFMDCRLRFTRIQHARHRIGTLWC
jgi:BCD family chlorophyll transporter-like MFS transporter